MKKIPFVKMQGAGNDFVLVDARRRLSVVWGPAFARKVCDRKFGVGGDGLLVVHRSCKADARMQIFNADGSEAEMCGNGARCLALYFSHVSKKKRFTIQTRNGTLQARRLGRERVRIRLGDPTDIRLNLGVRVGKTRYLAGYLVMGVPHAVLHVADFLNESPWVVPVGRAIRRHKMFSPAGTNVDFVCDACEEPADLDIRTYERGVEAETLACGTGVAAAAVVDVLLARAKKGFLGRKRYRRLIRTKSGQILAVSFVVSGRAVSDVELEGGAQVVFKGEYIY